MSIESIVVQQKSPQAVRSKTPRRAQTRKTRPRKTKPTKSRSPSTPDVAASPDDGFVHRSTRHRVSADVSVRDSAQVRVLLELADAQAKVLIDSLLFFTSVCVSGKRTRRGDRRGQCQASERTKRPGANNCGVVIPSIIRVCDSDEKSRSNCYPRCGIHCAIHYVTFSLW